MKTFGKALAILILVSGFTLSSGMGIANARFTARERAIHECNVVQKRNPHSYSGQQYYMYRACMAEHGEPG